MPLTITLLCLLRCSSALASECPNEQLRDESNLNVATGLPYSAQLPSCRAYELVSPPNAGGAVTEAPLNGLANGPDPGVSERGNLYAQLSSPLDVRDGGNVAFWLSEATPAGTGAVEDGDSVDTFRSVRSADGWSTEDLTPYRELSGGLAHKVLVGASADGSAALIATRLALTPSAFADPQQAENDPSPYFNLYRVTGHGASPQMVTGERLIPDEEELPEGSPFVALSASPDLTEVTFATSLRFEASDDCASPQVGGPMGGGGSAYLWNASVPLAHPIIKFLGQPCTSPNVNSVLGVLPDGRLILQPNPVNPLGLYGTGPVVENTPTLNAVGSLTELTGPASESEPLGASFLSVIPDGATAYVSTTDALDAHDPGVVARNIYAVSTMSGTLEESGATPGVTCVSCVSDQINVTYIGMSADGTHVLFSTDQGLWEWNASSGAHLLTPTAVTDLTPRSVVISENGQYIVGLTHQLGGNPGGELYEFSVGRSPLMIASGAQGETFALSFGSEHQVNPGTFYVSGGVSDNGSRVVFDALPAGGGPGVIDEWESGVMRLISPLASGANYRVASIAGAELEDVFFLAHDALAENDANAGASDVYDARIDGGQPAAAAPTDEIHTPDPTSPPLTLYPTNLTAASFAVPALGPDTSLTPIAKAQPKDLTRAQKLAKALKVCKKDKVKAKRERCEGQATKQYGRQVKVNRKKATK